jgi:DNA polymerase-3 subunit delta'
MFFTSIIGHEFQIEALGRSVEEKRVSHAYLFFGPDGVGKNLVAIEFARIINCRSLNNLTPEKEKATNECECISCKKIKKGIHPDVFLIEYGGIKDIKVDQIREELEDRLYFKPFEGRYKVAIVDEAHRMNLNAQNAFLKTLEEPPSDSVIILITSQPQALLPTIRSRCQLLEFKPLSLELVAQEIKKRTSLSLDESILSARLSGGSLGKALSLDKDLLQERKEIIMKLSNIKPNSASQVLDFVESMPRGSSSRDVDKLMFIFDIISLWLRDLVLMKIGFSQDFLSNRDLISVTQRLADKWGMDNILNKMKFLEKTWYAIFRGNANKQIALEHLVMNIVD